MGLNSVSQTALLHHHQRAFPPCPCQLHCCAVLVESSPSLGDGLLLTEPICMLSHFSTFSYLSKKMHIFFTFHFSPEANISGILAFLQGITLFNNVVTTLDLSNSDDIYTSLHKHTHLQAVIYCQILPADSQKQTSAELHFQCTFFHNVVGYI